MLTKLLVVLTLGLSHALAPETYMIPIYYNQLIEAVKPNYPVLVLCWIILLLLVQFNFNNKIIKASLNIVFIIITYLILQVSTDRLIQIWSDLYINRPIVDWFTESKAVMFFTIVGSIMTTIYAIIIITELELIKKTKLFIQKIPKNTVNTPDITLLIGYSLALLGITHLASVVEWMSDNKSVIYIMLIVIGVLPYLLIFIVVQVGFLAHIILEVISTDFPQWLRVSITVVLTILVSGLVIMALLRTNHNTYSSIVCSDGWVSHSSGRGTCSHHGGE